MLQFYEENFLMPPYDKICIYLIKRSNIKYFRGIDSWSSKLQTEAIGIELFVTRLRLRNDMLFLQERVLLHGVEIRMA